MEFFDSILSDNGIPLWNFLAILISIVSLILSFISVRYMRRTYEVENEADVVATLSLSQCKGSLKRNSARSKDIWGTCVENSLTNRSKSVDIYDVRKKTIMIVPYSGKMFKSCYKLLEDSHTGPNPPRGYGVFSPAIESILFQHGHQIEPFLEPSYSAGYKYRLLQSQLVIMLIYETQWVSNRKSAPLNKSTQYYRLEAHDDKNGAVQWELRKLTRMGPIGRLRWIVFSRSRELPDDPMGL